MLSKYTTVQILRRFKKILFINHWKVTKVLVSLKNITIYLKDS